MAEEVQKAEEIQKTENPKSEEAAREEAILAHKRKNALIAYLAVLFAVAFLLVAVSMIVENRRLQDSNSQNTATLNGKIADLQDEYNQLQKQSKTQETQIDTLQQELKSAQITVDEQASSITQLTEDLDGLQTENETLNANVEELTQKKKELTEELRAVKEENKDMGEIYELLFQAQAANEVGEMEELEKILKKIEPKKDLLSPTALDIYESLIID
jgi:septal ring factor EnvC (AmiA/AmiB activator)